MMRLLFFLTVRGLPLWTPEDDKLPSKTKSSSSGVFLFLALIKLNETFIMLYLKHNKMRCGEKQQNKSPIGLKCLREQIRVVFRVLLFSNDLN